MGCEGATGCKEEGGDGVLGWREEVEVDNLMAGCKEEGGEDSPCSEKEGDAGARGEACNFGSGCGLEGVLVSSCDEDEASTCVGAKLSSRGHACDASEGDCKFVRDEEETSAGEGGWSSRQVLLEGGD